MVLGVDITIDLGTSSVKIYLDGRGAILNELSIVTYEQDTDNIVTVGHEAYAMVGRTFSKIAMVHPLRNGVISDSAPAQHVIQHYLKRVDGSKMVMPWVVASVLCGIIEVEKRMVIDAISTPGVRKIYLIEEPVTAAMEAGVDISAPHGCFVIDIGGDTTDVGVILLSGVTITRSTKMAGDVFGEAIIRMVRHKYNLLVGTRMAEGVKMATGCVCPYEEVVTHRVKGRNMLIGLPQWADISCDEVLEALLRSAMQIIRTTQKALGKTPPELTGDIGIGGITPTDGFALLYDFDILISKKMKMKIFAPETPKNYMVTGAGKAISLTNDMEDKNYGVLNFLSVAC